MIVSQPIEEVRMIRREDFLGFLAEEEEEEEEEGGGMEEEGVTAEATVLNDDR